MASKHKYFLLFLSDIETKQVKSVLECSNKQQISAIREVIVNLLKGNIPIKESQKIKLSKHKTFFRKLAHKSQSRCVISHKSSAVKELLSVARPILIEL